MSKPNSNHLFIGFRSSKHHDKGITYKICVLFFFFCSLNLASEVSLYAQHRPPPLLPLLPPSLPSFSSWSCHPDHGSQSPSAQMSAAAAGGDIQHGSSRINPPRRGRWDTAGICDIFDATHGERKRFWENPEEIEAKRHDILPSRCPISLVSTFWREREKRLSLWIPSVSTGFCSCLATLLVDVFVEGGGVGPVSTQRKNIRFEVTACSKLVGRSGQTALILCFASSALSHRFWPVVA